MRSLVEGGEMPGLLAYAAGEPVGWCSVAPRASFPGLGRSRVLKAADDTPLWSVSCLFVAKGHRGRGVSVELLKAAGRYVAGRGGSVIEGYPVEPRTDPMPAAFAWTGLASAFLAAGFREHRRGSPTRPIMRLVVGPGAEAES
jgi:GNAT superfamily N-acetyltransferase